MGSNLSQFLEPLAARTYAKFGRRHYRSCGALRTHPTDSCGI